MGLEIDARRRAMLEEMGIRLWLPGDLPQSVKADEPPVKVALKSGSSAGSEAGGARSPAVAVRAAAPMLAPTREVFQPGPRPIGVAVMDWPTLQASVAACRACGLCQGRTNTVFGVGPAQADWLIVGEAPGEQEDLQAEPFVGASGHLLDNMLKAIGLHRAGRDAAAGATRPNVYITNVLKCRPPGNRNPQPDEVLMCTPYLQRQIELLQPRVILAMGRFATQFLLQGSIAEVERRPLGKLRGTVHCYQNGSIKVPVVVTYHPAYLLRNLAAKAQAWADLCLAQEVVGRPE